MNKILNIISLLAAILIIQGCYEDSTTEKPKEEQKNLENTNNDEYEDEEEDEGQKISFKYKKDSKEDSEEDGDGEEDSEGDPSTVIMSKSVLIPPTIVFNSPATVFHMQ